MTEYCNDIRHTATQKLKKDCKPKKSKILDFLMTCFQAIIAW